MHAFYQRLHAAGKPAKAALIAVARKLVVLANTLINEDRLWQPQSPQYA
jgi:transposase